MTLLPCMRHLFDIPSNIGYFNCAYNSPQLNESRRRLLAGVTEKSQPWQRTAASFFSDAETIRSISASLFGGSADGYAVIPAASYGISTAARAIESRLSPGDAILVLAEEFPSNVLPWKRVARETGAVIRTVPRRADDDWTSAVRNCMDADVKVVAVSPCHWTNGARVDLVEVGRMCRDYGAIFVVDATQALGAMPIALDEARPDFLVAAGYKWLLFPYGVGLMYVAEEWRHSRPLEETWLARERAEDFSTLADYAETYLPGARRFDVGEKCTANLLPGAIAALEQIRDWSIGDISDSLQAINRDIASLLEALGFRIPGEKMRSPHLFGVELPPNCSVNLVPELRAQGLFVSQRGSSVRFAPHLHVSTEDVARLCETIARLLG